MWSFRFALLTPPLPSAGSKVFPPDATPPTLRLNPCKSNRCPNSVNFPGQTTISSSDSIRAVCPGKDKLCLKPDHRSVLQYPAPRITSSSRYTLLGIFVILFLSNVWAHYSILHIAKWQGHQVAAPDTCYGLVLAPTLMFILNNWPDGLLVSPLECLVWATPLTLSSLRYSRHGQPSGDDFPMPHVPRLHGYALECSASRQWCSRLKSLYRGGYRVHLLELPIGQQHHEL